MARKRVKLAFMENKNSRRVTYKKRKESLIKKMDEITTLCDVKGCMAILNPQDGETFLWPSWEEAEELFRKYESLPSEDKKKVTDQKTYMEDRIEKLKQKIAKAEEKNKELKASLLLEQVSMGRTMEDLNIVEVELLVWYSEYKLEEIMKHNRLFPSFPIPQGVVPNPQN